MSLLMFGTVLFSGCGASKIKSSSENKMQSEMATISVAASNGEPSAINPLPPMMPDDKSKAPEYPKTDAKTYKFLDVQVSLPVPQSYYMFDKGLLESEMKPTGYKVERLLDDVHQQVLPNFYNGYYDFAYVPVNVLAEYWSGKVLCQKDNWQRGDQYVIIAGSYDGGISMMTGPEIGSLKDLDGKGVGIMNPSFNIEMQLNKMLAKVGLKTKNAGGTVNVVHNFPGNVMNDLIHKKLTAVFAWDMFKPQLKVLGFKEFRDWKNMGYGNQSPYMVLAVRKDILEKKPEVVKAVLRAHIKSIQMAEENSQFVDQTINTYNKYVTSLGRKPRPAQTFDFSNLVITYDPNTRFLQDTYDYMKQVNLFKKPVKFTDLINLNPMNEILKDEKLPSAQY